MAIRPIIMGKDIIAQAQGEKGLEEYLKQVLTCVYE
jgi:hypothetical protein